MPRGMGLRLVPTCFGASTVGGISAARPLGVGAWLCLGARSAGVSNAAYGFDAATATFSIASLAFSGGVWASLVSWSREDFKSEVLTTGLLADGGFSGLAEDASDGCFYCRIVVIVFLSVVVSCAAPVFTSAFAASAATFFAAAYLASSGLYMGAKRA